MAIEARRKSGEVASRGLWSELRDKNPFPRLGIGQQRRKGAKMGLPQKTQETQRQSEAVSRLVMELKIANCK
jgi:hypothetical protein